MMKHEKPSAILDSVKVFNIPEATRITVRWKDVESKLKQECVVTRRRGGAIQAKLTEFCGSECEIEVDLASRSARLASPDLSWFPEPQGFPVMVATKIGKMLSGRSPTDVCVARQVVLLT